jgi:hypothetical protein
MSRRHLRGRVFLTALKVSCWPKPSSVLSVRLAFGFVAPQVMPHAAGDGADVGDHHKLRRASVPMFD